MVKIENVTVETDKIYNKTDDYNSSESIEVLILRVKIPGGEAKYQLDLPKGMKESIENAVKLGGK